MDSSSAVTSAAWRRSCISRRRCEWRSTRARFAGSTGGALTGGRTELPNAGNFGRSVGDGDAPTAVSVGELADRCISGILMARGMSEARSTLRKRTRVLTEQSSRRARGGATGFLLLLEQLSILERPRADTITQHSRWTSTETKAQTGTHKRNPKRTDPLGNSHSYSVCSARNLDTRFKMLRHAACVPATCVANVVTHAHARL